MDIGAAGSQTRRETREAAIARIYTRKGDTGETSLFSGERAPKDDARFEALGAIDELVAALGLAKADISDDSVVVRISAIQGELYLALSQIAALGGTRETPAPSLGADAVTRLEAEIDALDAQLPPLTEFVMPGESRASAALHLARTICRRAERRVATVARGAALGVDAPAYLNRLSDYLFVLARAVDHDSGGADRTFKSTL